MPRILFRSPTAAKLKEFTRNHMVRITREGKRAQVLGLTEEDLKFILAFQLFSRAAAKPAGDLAGRHLFDATVLLLPGRRPFFSYGDSRDAFRGANPKDVLRFYLRTLERKIAGARLGLTLEAGGPVVRIVCPDVRTAAYVYAAYACVAVCKGCGRIFAPNPERPQKYCSKNCAQRIHQRNYRKREKQKRRNLKGRRSKRGG